VAEDSIAVAEALHKGADAPEDFLPDVVRTTLQTLMEAEVPSQIGAGRYEHSEERSTQRNGYRSRPIDTRVGTLELAIPKLRQGSYFPSWLEAHRRGGQALVSVVAEAYVQGVSTRKVEAWVQQPGITSLSKSDISRLVDSLSEQGRLFRERRLDARYEHVREDGHVRSMTVVVAYGVRRDRVREVLGMDVGESEHVALWRTFLQSLVGRGVPGVQLVISAAHAGLKQAIREVLLGASWQRCGVHFLRNVLAVVPKSAQAMVAATVRRIFEQESEQAARRQLRQVCTTLAARFPKVVALIEEAEEEILPSTASPRRTGGRSTARTRWCG
jgi:putative transposase